MAEATEEQRKAIRAFVDGTILPLIGTVLEKKLTQAAVFLRDELALPPAHEWLRVNDHQQFMEWAAGNAKPATVDWMAGWDACRRAAAGTAPSPRYFCNKCGYGGPVQTGHQRPNGTGECDYMAALKPSSPPGVEGGYGKTFGEQTLMPENKPK